MAVELCSDDNSTGRISFSYDFFLSENVPVEQLHTSTLGSNSIDFDFHVRKSFDQESSSTAAAADELFSDGKILAAAEIKRRNITRINDPSPSPSPSPSPDQSKKKEEKENTNTKSFWRFKRSSSLNCVSGYGRSLCPLPLLSRSNSTGSTPIGKESKNNNKQPYLRPPPPSSSSSTSWSGYNYQKPPLKKNYGNGVRVSPVLNVPSGNIFGGFFNAKDKNRRKK